MFSLLYVAQYDQLLTTETTKCLTILLHLIYVITELCFTVIGYYHLHLMKLPRAKFITTTEAESFKSNVYQTVCLYYRLFSSHYNGYISQTVLFTQIIP